ncbi:hypothetical protein CRG98_017093 [Punica granatum]|uniref:Cytochrome P450 CYP749A22-like n=1 Tax=Punica granatum TaxID=22663 RepID=A0A2I0K1N0_PUNGR|nr:hypothetical protein CRG98_017093 [Punica granatum]
MDHSLDFLVGSTSVVLFSSSVLGLVLLSLCLALARLVYKLWWNPIRIQRMMAAQGIKGPSYRFLHGNTKEIFTMRKEAMERPMASHLSHDVLPRLQPHIRTWVDTYGPNYLYWFGPQPQLVVTEPEMIKEKLLGDSLVTSAGEKWVKQRKLANHAFHGESLKSSFPAVVDSVHMMLEKWKDHEGKEIEVFEEFIFLTSEVISRTAFGSSYVEGRNIFEMLRGLGVLTSRNAFKLRLPGMSKIWKTADELDGYGNDFLGLLMQAFLEEDRNERITIDYVVDECKTFYVAGQETTNTMLTWTLFLLAVYTDWQEEARKDVLNVFGQRDPYHDGVTKLKTMTMIINESLRLYTPVTSLTREVSRQDRLGKLVVPANMHIFIANLKVHHDPQIWGEDAHLFKPESFTLSPAYVHSPTQILTTRPQHGVHVILHPLHREE